MKVNLPISFAGVVGNAPRALDQGVSGFTAAFVCQPNTTGQSSDGFLFLTHNAQQASRLAIIANPAQGGVRFIVNTQYEYPPEAPMCAATGAEYDPPGGSIPFSGSGGSAIWGVLIFRVDYTGTQAYGAYIAVNGGTPYTIPIAAYPSPHTTATPSYMDVLCSTSEGNYLTCNIAEAAFYASYLSDSAIGGLVSGLRQKYSF
jgi:hypothetical protein